MTETEGGVRRRVVISGTQKGLGIRIVGGRTVQVSDKESYFGIFIKEIISGSLAEKDGNLKRGDQILEVNGTSLVGVSNEKAVETLKAGAMTNKISLIVSRDPESQKDFRRLSNSLLLQTSEDPVATSTPRSAQPVVEVGARQNGDHDGKDFQEAKRQSTSSTLTQISTTDISSHGDELDNDDDELIDAEALNKNLQRHARERSQKSIALSDVVLEEVSGVGAGEGRKGEMPPPVPSSPPPSLEIEDSVQIKPTKRKPREAEVAMSLAGSAVAGVVLRGRSSPEGKAMSPPPSASLSSSLLHKMYTFVIPKTSGLGIIIGGGEGRPDGPYIVIDKILGGMDADKDGNLRIGDRLIMINENDFRNVKREKALAILSQLKTNRSVTTYNITVERSADDKTDTGPPTFLPSPQRDTDMSIFNSDTLLASEVSRTKPSKDDSEGTSPSKKSTPLRYLAKKDSGKRKERPRDSMHNRLSMDPSALCKLSKLEWALKYMGYNITPEQQKEMHALLDIDDKGRVIFNEFVKLAQEMFAFKLEGSHLETNLMLALTQKEEMDMPPMPRKSSSYEHIWDQNLRDPLIKPASSQPLLPLASSQPTLPPAISSNSIHTEEELVKMRRELHELGYHRDKERMLSESARQNLEKEKQLTEHLRRELKRKEEELRMLQNRSTISEEDEEVLMKRIRMTEEAHRSERDRSNRLEDKMRKMDAELSVLRDHRPQMTLDELRKKLAVLDNELGKEKGTSRRYQVAVERLMEFVENCHEALVKSPEVDRVMYHPHGKGSTAQRGNAVTGNPRPPQYLSRHAKLTATTLAQEAQETMAAVRKMMETKPLPYGWQEAYTEEGQKYYINHETQMTSWVHPVTKVAGNSSHSSMQSLPPSGRTTPTPVHH